MYQLTKEQYDAICFASHCTEATVIEQFGLFAVETTRYDGTLKIKHLSKFFPSDELTNWIERLKADTKDIKKYNN